MRFKRIYIEISNTCNLSCSFCIQNKREEKNITLEQFKFIVSEVKNFSDYVYLHVMGEPLMHPQLKEILSICKEANLKVNITTNATLLLRQVKTLIAADCVRQVNISLHSYKHQKLQQAAYLNSVKEAVEQLKEAKIHSSIRLWNKKNQQLEEDMKEILKDILSNYTYDMEEILSQRRASLEPFVHLHFEEVFAWPSMDCQEISKTGSCYGMRTMCAILVDGSVVPCCLDSNGDITLGNIFESSFQSNIGGEQAKKMMEGFQNNQIVEALCKRCGYRQRFDS